MDRKRLHRRPLRPRFGIWVSLGVVLALLGLPGALPANAVPVPARLHPLDLPTPTWSVPIQISNAQASPTGAYQQMVVVNSSRYSAYLNSNDSNVEWRYPNGTAIYAWMEANNSNASTRTTWWLKLYDIPADSNRTVYMDVYGKTDYLLSEFGPSGEAPQLSASYGALDDGARVFNFYDNFSGASLRPGWVDHRGFAGAGVGTALTVSDGLTISTGTGSNQIGRWETYNYSAPSPLVVGALVLGFSGANSNGGGIAEMNASYVNSNASSSDGAIFVHEGTGGNYAEGCENSLGGGYVNIGTYSLLPGRVAEEVWTNPTASIVVGLNYSFQSAISTSVTGCSPSVSTVRPSLGIWPWNPSTTVSYQWARARAYPPSNVMPTVTFLPPTAPTSFSVTASTASSISLGWSNSGNATNDTLYWGPNCSALRPFTSSIYTSGSLGVRSNLTLLDLPSGASYCFAIASWNLAGMSPWAYASGRTANLGASIGGGAPAFFGGSLFLVVLVLVVATVAAIVILPAVFKERRHSESKPTRIPAGRSR